MHADGAVTGLSRTPATTARNTVQPLADVVNVTLKSKSGQTANHIEGRSSANVLQWSISAVGAAVVTALTVSGASIINTLQASGAALFLATAATLGVHSFDSDLALTSDVVIRRSIANGITEITGGNAAANGANLKLWGDSGSNGPDFALRTDGTNILFFDASANIVQVTPLAGTGTRVVTASSTGILGTSDAVVTSVTGTTNTIAMFTGTHSIGDATGFRWEPGDGGYFTFDNANGLLILHTLTVYEAVEFFGTVSMDTLTGTGTRVALVTNLGVLSVSGNLTFDGTTLAVTGAQTISSTLAVTGTTRHTDLVAIGSSVAGTAVALRINGTVSSVTASSQYGIDVSNTFSSAATVAGTSLYAQVVTAAASFTMANAYGVHVDSVVKGSGSTITTAYGIKVENQTQGGTNYALFTGLGLVRFGDVLAIGTTPSAGTALLISGTGVVSGTTQKGITISPTFSTAATTAWSILEITPVTAAGSYTTTIGRGILIGNFTKGAGSTITTLVGLDIQQMDQGATNRAIRTNTGTVEFGDGVLIRDTGFYTSGVSLGVKRDDGVSSGEHFVAEFYRTNGGTAQLLIGYRADGAAVTGQLIRSGNSLPIFIGTSSSNQAVTIANSGAVTFAAAVTATGGIVFNGGGTNLNHYETGSWSAGLTGVSGSPTATINYVRIGNMVMLHFTNSLIGTSSSNACTITGVPSSIRPSTAKSLFGNFNIQNGSGSGTDAGLNAGMQIDTGGTITLWVANSTIGFGSGSNKGVIGANALGASGHFAVCYTMS